MHTYININLRVFFHFYAQHEAVRMELFYTSLNNNIYPAELTHINCISHFFFWKQNETMHKIIIILKLNVMFKIQFFYSSYINHVFSLLEW